MGGVLLCEWGTWRARHRLGEAVNFWLWAIPVGIALLTFIYYLFKAPYEIYVKLYKEKQAEIAALEKRLEPFLKKPIQTVAPSMIVQLSHPNQLHGGDFKISVQNKTSAAIQNVKVELIGMYPAALQLPNPKFPINLSPIDKSRTINPGATAYFALLIIEVEPGKRRVILTDENGSVQSFEADLSEMLHLFKREGYALKLIVSSANLPKVEKTCMLILTPEWEDVNGLKPLLGYNILIDGLSGGLLDSLRVR